jgi:ATP-binding cassette, subfamily B, multidrug efflux pump
MPYEFIKADTLPKEPIRHLPDRVLPFVWHFVRQAKWQFIVITALFSISNMMITFIPYTIKMIVDAVERGSAIGQMASSEFYFAIIVFVVMLAVRSLLEIICYMLCASSYSSFTNMIRRQVSQYVNNHSYRYFQDDFAGRISSKVMDSPSAIQNFVFTLIDQGLYIIVLFTGTFLMFLYTIPEFSGVLLIWIFVYILIMCIMIPRIRARTTIAAKNKNIFTGRMVDVISNVLLVKLFARRAYEDNVMLGLARGNAHGFIARDHTSQLMQSLIFVTLIGLTGAALWIMAGEFKQGTLSVGQASMLLTSLMVIYNNSLWASSMFTDLFRNYGEIYEGIDLITQAHDVTDTKTAKNLVITKGDVLIKDLTFTYPGRPVFENLNLHIPAGQKIGLVGPSGAGKSTLVQLMLRLFDVQAGGIYIDSDNIADVYQDSLRSQIAVIPQNSDLLHRSIRDNIKYGRLDATDEEIVEAARKAFAHEFILELADKNGQTGYDALVGERGVKLSGGQRQRIAIARAILKNAPILLLDEATSALDSDSEAKIQTALFELMKGRTVIAIAHRLSTIAHMDRLIVMHDGRIIEDGNHETLLAMGGLYASLWQRQAGGFIKN